MKRLNFNDYTNNFKKYCHISSIDCSYKEEQKEDIFITIAIPTYKRPDLLKETLESVMNQKNNDFTYEIIVVDNEPFSLIETDTCKLMNCYKERQNVRYYRNKENLGMIGNWNRCFELAKGKWVALLHDDDLLKNNYLSRIDYFIKKKKKVDCICVEKEYIGDRNYKTENFKDIKKKAKDKLYKIRLFDSFLTNLDVYGAPTCGTIFRKKALIEMGGFDDEWIGSSDWFGCLKFNFKNTVYKTIEPLGIYRWERNETFNIKTQIAFIEDKLFLREYFKKSNVFMKIWIDFYEEEYMKISLKYGLKFCESTSFFEGKKILSEKYEEVVLNRNYKSIMLDFIIKWYMRTKKLYAVIFG